MGGSSDLGNGDLVCEAPFSWSGHLNHNGVSQSLLSSSDFSHQKSSQAGNVVKSVERKEGTRRQIMKNSTKMKKWGRTLRRMIPTDSNKL